MEVSSLASAWFYSISLHGHRFKPHFTVQEKFGELDTLPCTTKHPDMLGRTVSLSAAEYKCWHPMERRPYPIYPPPRRTSKDDRPPLQCPQDGIGRLGFDCEMFCLCQSRREQPARKGGADGRQHQAWFHGSTFLEQARVGGTIWRIFDPTVRLLDDYCVQWVSPTGMDERIRPPVTSRCLWS